MENPQLEYHQTPKIVYNNNIITKVLTISKNRSMKRILAIGTVTLYKIFNFSLKKRKTLGGCRD